MPDPIVTTEPEATAIPLSDEPKAHFTKAVEEARAGAQLLGKQAQDQAEVYRDKLGEAATAWSSTAKAKGDEAKDRAFQLAKEGKARTSGAFSGLSKMVEDNAALADERFGVRYGDYVRGAARSLQDVADRLEQKDLTEMADDARTFVRGYPALAVGMAAIGGFFFARMFKGPDS